jgi:hypothetical protein
MPKAEQTRLATAARRLRRAKALKSEERKVPTTPKKG